MILDSPMYLAVVTSCFIVYLFMCITGELRLTPMHFIGFMGVSIIPGINVVFLVWCLYYVVPNFINILKTNTGRWDDNNY